MIIPLSLMRPADIRNIKEPGLILPIAPTSPAVAVTLLDGTPFAVVLDGPSAFTSFKIDMNSRFFGLSLAAPQIVVEVTSAVRGASVWDKPGTLILENGRTNVVASRAGDTWNDPSNIPLWQDTGDAEAEGDTVGFTSWSLRIMDGQQQIIVWHSET